MSTFKNDWNFRNESLRYAWRTKDVRRLSSLAHCQSHDGRFSGTIFGRTEIGCLFNFKIRHNNKKEERLPEIQFHEHFFVFHFQAPIAKLGGGQNLERPNVEQPIFQKFETSNIEITKVELFDFFIFKFIFYIYVFLNCSNIQNIW